MPVHIIVIHGTVTATRRCACSPWPAGGGEALAARGRAHELDPPRGASLPGPAPSRSPPEGSDPLAGADPRGHHQLLERARAVERVGSEVLLLDRASGGHEVCVNLPELGDGGTV